MGILFFIFLFFSSLLLPLSLIFPFCFASLIIQLLIGSMAIHSWLKARKNDTKRFLLGFSAFFHTIFLLLILAATLFIALPQKEEGDFVAITLGIKKFISSTMGVQFDLQTSEKFPQKNDDQLPSQATDIEANTSLTDTSSSDNNDLFYEDKTDEVKIQMEDEPTNSTSSSSDNQI